MKELCKKSQLLLIAFITITQVHLQARVIYVDANLPNENYHYISGNNWNTAYPYLQDALYFANAGDSIFIAEGYYYPDDSFYNSAIQNNDPSVYFEIKDSLKIFGGFKTGDNIYQRNPSINKSILDGDIGNTYAYTLVATFGVSDQTIVDGIYIQNAWSPNDLSFPLIEHSGAGWFNQGTNGKASKPILRNITFEACFTQYGNGGTIYNDGSQDPANLTLEDCTFNWTRGRFGGHIFNNGNSGNANINIDNCTFYQGDAIRGGCIYNEGSNGIASINVTNSIFKHSLAIQNGAAFYNSADGSGNAFSSFINCLFHNLQTFSVDGGGIYNEGINNGSVSSSIVNCTFTDNESTGNTAVLHNIGTNGSCHTEIFNSIIWSNTSADNIQINNIDATVTMASGIYDDGLEDGNISLPTGVSGINILDANPLFSDSANEDYSLNVNSPAINSGDDSFNNTAIDLNNNDRFQSSAIDMGPYEYTVQNLDCEDVADIYWLDQGNKIAKTNSFSNSTETAFELNEVIDFALDSISNYIYWSERNTVYKRAINGSDEIIEVLSDGKISYLYYHHDAEKLYLVVDDTTIKRCDKDGANLELVVPENNDWFIGGVAVDDRDGDIVWTHPKINSGDPTLLNVIYKSDSMGNNPHFIFGDFSHYPYKPRYEYSSDQIYYKSSNSTYRIPETLSASSDHVLSIGNYAIDHNQLKLYYGINDSFYSSDLDGTNEALLLDGIDYPLIYFYNSISDKLISKNTPKYGLFQTSKLVDNTENIMFYRPNSVNAYAIDESSKVLYYAAGSNLFSYDMKTDDRNIDLVLHTNDGLINDIQIDHLNNKIYWSSAASNQIHKCNLDGTNVEDLIAPGISKPRRLRLDISSNKIYWSDNNNMKIYSAYLDGTNVSSFVTTGTPYGFDVDFINNKIYYADYTSKSIYKCDLNGTNIELVVDHGVEQVENLTLDIEGNKIYFTRNDGPIFSSQLDGTNIKYERPEQNSYISGKITVDRKPANNIVYTTDTSSVLSLQKVIDNAIDGDTIFFSQCMHFDTIKGPITVDKNVTLYSYVEDSIYIESLINVPSFFILNNKEVTIEGLHLIAPKNPNQYIINNKGDLVLKNTLMHQAKPGNNLINVMNVSNGITRMEGISYILKKE